MNMEISYLPSDYLINGIRKLEYIQRVESTFLLRAVKIKNNSQNTIKLLHYKFEILKNNNCVKTIIYDEDIVKEKAEDVKQILERLLNPDVSKIFLGVDQFWNKDEYSSNILEPNQETGFRLEYFTHLDIEPVDKLVLTVTYIEEEVEKEKVCTIHIFDYENRNKYIFPLKGAWLVLNTFDNPYEHRRMHSQEFGFDLGQVDEKMKFIPSEGNENKFFGFHGKEVIAIADGEVVETFGEIEENPVAGELMSQEKVKENFEKYGYKPLAAGNYVIVEHAGGECSFYAHLIPNSIKVKEGDKVKQGQVLGLLGNSGNSTAPHLHFQLMKGTDFLTARGLPCHFTNITGLEGEKIELIDKNRSIVYTD
jgi:hypothetical protein